jgi:acyl-CoA dehydrogenase
MQAVAESGAGMTGASTIHLPVFGMQPVVLFGTDEQKNQFIPGVVSGKDRVCFAVTEPNAGLNTTELKTRAEKVSGGYKVNGEKIWISTAQVANKMLLLARTTPLDQVKRKTDGLTLFYTDLDRSKIEVRLIHKMGRHAVDSNMLFITDLFIPDAHRIGEEGQGFKIILHGLNPERVLLGAEAVGIGRAAIQRAARYARERIVFGRPIGQNQGIAHPLAKCWAQLEAANLMVMKAATLFDRHEDCGVEANAGKYLAAEFAFEACHTAMLTLGGMGYAQEYHVERLLREVLIPRTAPVSPHMILNFLAEKVLELPKSY